MHTLRDQLDYEMLLLNKQDVDPSLHTSLPTVLSTRPFSDSASGTGVPWMSDSNCVCRCRYRYKATPVCCCPLVCT